MEPSCAVRIQQHYSQLSPLERKIGDYILSHPRQVVEMSVQELAAAAGAAPSGVIRFCKRLGYRGYTQLKISLAGRQPAPEDMILPAVFPDDGTSQVFDKVFTSSMKTLKDTMEIMDRSSLQKAAELLHQAETIVFFGVGTSSTIAMDAYYRLMRIGYPAVCATDSYIMRTAASGLGPGDAAVGISHSGRTIETRDALKIARSKGAGTIVITSRPGSPVAAQGDLVLCVYSDEVRYPIEAVTARIAHIAVLDALCVALSLMEYDRTVEHIREMNRLFEDLRRE